MTVIKGKKLLSLLLCAVLLMGNVPAAFAQSEAGCTHHLEHTADCGYAPAVLGADCTHSHDAALCSYAPEQPEVPCTCTETDENGALVHVENCGYVPYAAEAACGHEHDGVCGYIQAADEQPCAFHCDICHPNDGGEEEPACTCQSGDPAYHAPFCALYERTGAACLCENKCTEENPNNYCEVCYFDGIAACTGSAEDASAPYTGASMEVTAPTAISGLVFNGYDQNLINAPEGAVLEYAVSTVNNSSNLSWSSDIPAKAYADTYYVWYRVQGTDFICSEPLVISIAKAQFKLHEVPTPYTNLVYNGEAQSLIYEHGWLASVTTSISNTQYAVSTDQDADPQNLTWGDEATATEAGTYYVWYGSKGANNYEPFISESPLTVTISEAGDGSVSYAAPTARSGLKYNGYHQNLVEYGYVSPDTLTMKYAVSYAKDTIPSTFEKWVPSDTDAGTYYVYWKIVDDQGNDVINNCIEVTIGKAEAPAINFPGSAEVIYGQTLADSTLSGGSTQYGSFTWKDPSIAPTADGSYTMVFTPSASTLKNYDGVASAEKEVPVTVSKATPSVTAPTANTLTYNGKAQALVAAGSATGGVVKYSLLQDGTYGSEVPTETNAGTYTVWYKVEGDSNHNDVAPQSVEVIINPKEVTAPTFAELKENYLYQNGAEIKSGFKLMDGETEIPASEYSVSYSDNTQKGTAAITVTDKTGGNYTVSGSAAFKIVVHEHNWSYSTSGATITAACSVIDTCPDAEQSITLNVPESYTYTGDAKYSATVDGSIEGVTYSLLYTGAATGYSSAEPPVNADTYTVTLSAGEKTVSNSYTIRPKEVTVTGVAAANRDYNGEKTVTLSGGSVDGAVGSDNVTVDISAAVGTMADANAGKNKAVTITGVKLGGTAAGNYELTAQPSGVTVTISPKAITPTVTLSFTKADYTGKEHKPTLTLKDGEAVIPTGEYDVTYGDNTNAGTASVTIKAKTDGNYSFGDITENFTINKVKLTITADDKQAKVGDSKPELSYTVKGLVNGEKLSTEPTLSCSAKMDTAGVYAITASGAVASGNYEISYVEGKLTVARMFAVSTAAASNGSVSSSHSSAAAGDTVTLTAKPASGYKLSTLYAKDASGKSLTLTYIGSNNYTFVMPASDVTVSSTFIPSYAPASGDDARPLLWLSLMLLSAGGIGTVLLSAKKRREEN